MSSNVDKIVKIYRNLSAIPSLTTAYFLNSSNVINSVWSQRNIETGENIKFTQTIVTGTESLKQLELLPIDISKELLSSISPSQKLRAVLRNVTEKQFLEIWQNQKLSRVVDLGALELHGDVYTDGEFQSFNWSPDENRLLYIAELKTPQSDPFYKRGSKKADNKNSRGDEFLYVQDWGEQLVGKKNSVIAEYNVEKDEVEILAGIPDDVCPAQVNYSPDGNYVVGVAYKTEPRKLGLIYCTNRLSTIFSLDYTGKYITLPLNGKSVKSPIITPDGKTLLWLQRNAGGPHMACYALMKVAIPFTDTNGPSVVIPSVQNEMETENGSKFYGLYNTNFIKRCFASDNRLVLSTNQKNTINTYVIDIDSGKINELFYNEGSQVVLDIFDDFILVNRRSYLKSDRLVISKIPPKGSELNLTWKDLTISETPNGLENCIYEYLDLTQNTDDSIKTFTAIYLGPKTAPEKSVNLIVYPHGGPHSAFANNLTLEGSLFLSLGFAIIYINYRGSIGAGDDSVQFLNGKIGNTDVADCVLSLETILEKKPFLNPNGAVLFGGSHGGFLVTHLSGKYPDTFKAVVARNPVTDVASMSIISDIPDWCYVEAGYDYTQIGKPSDEILLAMRKASPIELVNKVKAPTLLMVGSKDLRVPPLQGLDYFTRLKANGVTVRLNLYDDNHPLAKIPNEMDNLINALLWFQKYTE